MKIRELQWEFLKIYCLPSIFLIQRGAKVVVEGREVNGFAQKMVVSVVLRNPVFGIGLFTEFIFTDTVKIPRKCFKQLSS